MAISLTTSVGRNAVNEKSDVKKIQKLLNECRHLLIPFVDKVDESGDADSTLIERIELFQRRVVVGVDVDGRIDPAGRTLAKLNENARGIAPKIPLFPFTRPATHDFNTGARFFGAPRDNGKRKHAGVDLKMPPDTPIRAMEDGVVAQAPRTFFQSTQAFTIDHGIFLARYCEIRTTAPGVGSVGAKVKKGDVIAFVGKLDSGNSMLHLELYTNTVSGELSNSTLPFRRRSDLLNPMDFVRAATMTSVSVPAEGNATVSPRVTTSLRVRDKAKLSGSKVVANLAPGSSFDVLGTVTGDAYPTHEGENNEWVEVDLGSAKGFAAAFYVEHDQPGPAGPRGMVDEIRAFGRVSSRVTTVLHLRNKADLSGVKVTPSGLTTGTILKIKQKLKGGTYQAAGADHDDWLEVSVQGDAGFVAAFFVDPVLRRGRANAEVTSALSLRAKPDVDSERLAALSRGTTFSVIDSVKGAPYDAGPGQQADWYQVEHDSTQGFVAAFFVDLFDPSQTNDVNTVLLTYEPKGASDKTARQDGLPQRGIHGVDASVAMARADAARVLAHKRTFNAAGELFDLPPALLAAIASRESRGGNALDRNGEGDHGNAFGIMQVDKRFHSPVETDGGPAGAAHIEQAAGILLDKLETVQRRIESLSDSRALQMAVSKYNGGRGLQPPDSDVGTTGGDYMNDVWARARFYAETW